MKAIQARAALSLTAALLLVGCASGGGSPGASNAPGTTTVTETTTATTTAAAAITIKDFDYGAPLTVEPAAVVVVTNMDVAGHTVTVDEGSAFDVDVRGNGGTATFTAPSVPGTYPYHCTYHPNMHGTLIVK